jgi:hypothetical protein
VKLGNPNGAHALRGKQTGNAEAVAKIKEKAAQRAMDLRGIIDGIKRSGITSVRAITEELNRQGMWLVLRSARRQRTPTRVLSHLQNESVPNSTMRLFAAALAG